MAPKCSLANTILKSALKIAYNIYHGIVATFTDVATSCSFWAHDIEKVIPTGVVEDKIKQPSVKRAKDSLLPY